MLQDDAFLPQDDRYVQTAKFCRKHLDAAIYREKIKQRSDETIANIAITLIHQCDRLIVGLIEWLKRDFIQKGGIKEQMYQARKEWQRRNGYYSGGYSGVGGYSGQGSTVPTTPTSPIVPTTPTTPTSPTNSPKNDE